MFYLIDGIIRNHSGMDKVLDFEGSMILSIARFLVVLGLSRVYILIIKGAHYRQVKPWLTLNGNLNLYRHMLSISKISLKELKAL